MNDARRSSVFFNLPIILNQYTLDVNPRFMKKNERFSTRPMSAIYWILIYIYCIIYFVVMVLLYMEVEWVRDRHG